MDILSFFGLEKPDPLAWLTRIAQSLRTQTPQDYARQNFQPLQQIIPKAVGQVQQRAQQTPILPFLPGLTPKAMSTYQAPGEQQVQKMNPLLKNILGPISDVPGFVGENVRQVGRFTGLQPNALDVATLPLMMGGLKAKGSLSEASKLAATEKMSNLFHYPKELAARGYTPKQLDFISAKEARRIISENIAPTIHPSALKAWQATKQFVTKTIQEGSQQEINTVHRAIDGGFPVDVANKVGFFDYWKTPEAVLNKIGLGQEAKVLRAHYEAYLDELPVQIDKIRLWANQVPKESNVRIFKHLDGELLELTKTESKIAGEIRRYLREWANRLKLPSDKRVSDYITHIWERGGVQQEFDPEIAKLIEGKVAGSVYDPFLLKRTGGRIDYRQDTWAALQAYTKRAVRKVNLDPALELLKGKADQLELSQYKYLQRLTDRINLRPTEIDDLIDTAIKQTPVGYKLGQRPTAVITQGLRKAVYRGTLGLNVSSAIRNLTQGINTFSELGVKDTTVGYLKLAKNWNSGELEKVGVLRDSFIQDQNLTVFKNILAKADTGLMALFNFAEKVNRGAAYYGAKARALRNGAGEQQAVDFAKGVVRKTQFTFGSIDTPLALSSDIGKTVGQLQSYNIKQIEFLANKVAQKDMAGLLRFVGSTLVVAKVLKDAFGIKLSLLPVNFSLTPSLQAAKGVGELAFGDKEQGLTDIGKVLPAFVPGGVQFKKTAGALSNIAQGGEKNAKGQLKYPAPQDIQGQLRSIIFGPNATPEAQTYYDKNRTPLTTKQTKAVEGGASFDAIQYARRANSLKAKLADIRKNPDLSPEEKKRQIDKLIAEYERGQ